MPAGQNTSPNSSRAPIGDPERRIQELEHRLAQLERDAKQDRGSNSSLAFAGKVYVSYVAISSVLGVIAVIVALLCGFFDSWQMP